MKEPVISVRFLVDEVDVDELMSELKSPDVTIGTTKMESDPTSADFGVIEVAAVATIISLAFYTGELAQRIVNHLRSRKKSITIQTPMSRLEFTYEKNLTNEEIKKILESSIEMFK